MSSWQAHATDMYARFWLKRRLAGKKDLARARAILSGGALPIPPGAAFRRAALSGVSGEWVTPPGPQLDLCCCICTVAAISRAARARIAR